MFLCGVILWNSVIRIIFIFIYINKILIKCNKIILICLDFVLLRFKCKLNRINMYLVKLVGVCCIFIIFMLGCCYLFNIYLIVLVFCIVLDII